MKKAIKIPAFYKALSKEACNAYLRRIVCKRSTAHWHLDFGGIRFWFWRIWEDEGGRQFDSKTHVAALLPWWQKKGIALGHLLYHSFNKPKEATK